MFEQHDYLSTLRHSTSHIMAYAVKKLFKNVKLGIGPSIEEGFYYDFQLENGKVFTPEDLLSIEQEMKNIINSKCEFKRIETSYEQAKEMLENASEALKLELLEEFKNEKITFYKSGDFIDLCAGPHINDASEVAIFKLLKIAGAYWRGDESRGISLQRIYGTAFLAQEELDVYLKMIEDAEKRDHRRLGQELDLFSIHHQEAGAGFVYWHPKGAVVRETIENFWKQKHKECGYQLVYTPHLVKANLWKTSGHYQMKYPMYFTEIDNEEYGIKPMNCPGHILIYKTHTRSYRDLPIRYAEMGTVYRHERSGVLHGMLRVRGFTQDDAHIFCLPEQLLNEMLSILDLVHYILKLFDFDYEVYVSTKPDESIGSDKNWETATNALNEALLKKNISYKVDPGAGVFYGPKIDIKLKDAIGRTWQGPTIQVDFNLPERFSIEYVDATGQRCTPVMIHRAIFGSFERFMGVLIEHYSGSFPFWLSPVQVIIIPIASRHLDKASEIGKILQKYEMRTEVNEKNEKLGAKIRNAQLQKIPFMIIVGDKECEDGKIAVRSRDKGDIGRLEVEKFIFTIQKEQELFFSSNDLVEKLILTP